MIIIPCIIFTIAALILTIWAFDITSNKSGIAEAIGFTFSVVSLSAMVSGVVASVLFTSAFFTTHSDYFNKRARIDVEERRKAIIFCIENDELDAVALSQDISNFNSEVMKAQMDLQNFWLKDVTHDFYREIELIEVE